MTHSDAQLMQMVYRQTTKNLREMFTKAHYNMMGEGFGAHKGFICQILYSDSSYYLMVRFNESRSIMWMQLFLPVWIPHKKREQVAAFLNAYSAKRNWGRLDMDECGLVCALAYVELDSYRSTLKALLKEMEGVMNEVGGDIQSMEKLLIKHCAPDVESLKEMMRSLKSILFNCEDEIVSMVYPGASIDGKGGHRSRSAVAHGIPNGGGDDPDEDDPAEVDGNPDDDDEDDMEDISGLTAAFRRLLDGSLDGDDPDDGDDESGGEEPDDGEDAPAPSGTESASSTEDAGKASVRPRITGLPPED